jgi:biopolymer transport protein ExbD
MKLKSGYENKRARVEMLPLIDVVFLLLVFFIYAMVSMVLHHGIQVDLPEIGKLQADHRAYISITITADNEILVNRQPETLETLLPAVQRLLQEQTPETPVYIEGDQAANLGLAVHILNHLQRAGITKVSFACKNGQP